MIWITTSKRSKIHFKFRVVCVCAICAISCSIRNLCTQISPNLRISNRLYDPSPEPLRLSDASNSLLGVLPSNPTRPEITEVSKAANLQHKVSPQAPDRAFARSCLGTQRASDSAPASSASRTTYVATLWSVSTWTNWPNGGQTRWIWRTALVR